MAVTESTEINIPADPVFGKSREGKCPQCDQGKRLPGSPGSSESSKKIEPKEEHTMTHHDLCLGTHLSCGLFLRNVSGCMQRKCTFHLVASVSSSTCHSSVSLAITVSLPSRVLPLDHPPGNCRHYGTWPFARPGPEIPCKNTAILYKKKIHAAPRHTEVVIVTPSLQ